MTHLDLGTAQHSISLGDHELQKLVSTTRCSLLCKGREEEGCVQTKHSAGQYRECKLMLTKACPNSELQINP